MSGVVVTGAASGIGGASAEALVADGRKVALWDIAPQVVEVAEGLAMPGAVIDVCDSAAMERAIETSTRKLGGIDGLVHAAGRVISEPVGTYTQDSWDAVVASRSPAGLFLGVDEAGSAVGLLPRWNWSVFMSSSPITRRGSLRPQRG